MSETDKYDAAIDTIGNLWLDAADRAASAYLREHFVTREECVADMLLCDRAIATLTAERDRLREALGQAAHNLEAGARLYDCPGLQEAAMQARQAMNPEDV